MQSLFHLPEPPQAADGGERFEPILSGSDGLLVERIISTGQTTSPGHWYDQEKDEWVCVLEGEAGILYENGREHHLTRGSTLFIPRRLRHRVTYTSSPCIWLAVHGFLREASPPDS